ncbi:glycosyltransferase [Metabacillus litoralis]|uniref:Glycosyl transferase n=1 Tax=Metabacillus litoralis TaxID=152268 RepID=A0A179STT1_9BACI|nr:glycosyltransferase [Metabacillus litoralis]OAS85137.1 glycosyl transferase [Metabacillus litoralis]
MKKNILITLYDMEIGGIERSLINMLESFDYNKFNVDLFICEHKGDLMSQIPGKVNVLPQISKYTVFRKPVKQCIKEGHFTTSLIRVVSRSIAEVKARKGNLEEGSGYIQMQLVQKYSTLFLPRLKKKYDVAISYAWPHDIVVKNVNADKKIAWIHTDYSMLEIDNSIDLMIWKRFDHIVSISDECSKSFLMKYPTLKEKVVIIENITSPNFIHKMSHDPISFSEGNFNILSVGRLSYVKGFDMAIKALRLLHDKGYTFIKWYVIGYGGYEKELIEMISNYNLNESFILLGKKTNPYPYMNACDLYIQPSRYEGKAVTVTEAKILGKPIIITNYPTAKSQLINRIEGIICDLSVQGISQEVERLIRSDKEQKNLIENLKKTNYGNVEELEKLYKLIG